MPKGIPSTPGGGDVAPLTVKRIKSAKLTRMAAFRQSSTRKDDRTGAMKEIDQVKLSLWWDTGHIQRDADGAPVLDDRGKEQPHYINEGFLTLSGYRKGKFVTVVTALGLGKYITDDGDLSDEADATLEVLFGHSGSGGDYRTADWNDLPYYVPRAEGGDVPKRDVEVEVQSFKIDGIELIGRSCEMAIKVDKNGYNRITAYLEPEDHDPEQLKELQKPAAGMPDVEDDELPFDSGGTLTQDAALGRTITLLQQHGVVEEKDMLGVLQFSLKERVKSLAKVAPAQHEKFQTLTEEQIEAALVEYTEWLADRE